MDIEFDLKEGLKDPAKAKEVVAKVQETVNELIAALKETKEAGAAANNLTKEYEARLITSEKTIVDLTTVIKNIHIVLGARRDAFAGDKGLLAIMEELDKFVMSSGAIKAGVIANAGKENETGN